MDSKGISVIICCYNSAWVIEETLQYLFNQKISSNISWEIVLVDNNSTDETSIIVKESFSKYNLKNIDARLVFEATPGLTNARNKGVAEARYEYLLFCDDDNFLSEYYLQKVFDIMEGNTSIGACGGKGIALMRECGEPAWFKQHQHSYATGSQNNRISSEPLRLYGAGVCFRKTALNDIKANGFEPQLTGRTGTLLLAGEDTELTSAIKLLGYHLYTSDELQFFHLLQKRRLEETYLLKMYKGFGIAEAVLYFYKRETNRIYNKSTNRELPPYEDFYPIFLFMSFLRFVYYSKQSNLYNKYLYNYNKGVVLGAFRLASKSFKVRKIINQLLKSKRMTKSLD